MRVALVAPLVSTIAQPYLGGAQALLADLAQGLMHRGHSVTLFARNESFVPGIEIEPVAVPDDVQPADFSGPAQERPADSSFFTQANLFLDLFLQLQRRSAEFDLLLGQTVQALRRGVGFLFIIECGIRDLQRDIGAGDGLPHRLLRGLRIRLCALQLVARLPCSPTDSPVRLDSEENAVVARIPQVEWRDRVVQSADIEHRVHRGALTGEVGLRARYLVGRRH